jgi:hypothetical protein
MDTDALFVATLDWLHRASSRDPLDAYEMVLTSGRLRLLLLDGAPLVHTVNRERRLKLVFDVGDHSPPPPPLPQPLFWAVPDGLNPNHMSTTHNVPMLSLSLDEFLARRILVYEGVDVTVKELIRHAAHVSGGVHAGEPENDTERKLDELAEAMLAQGMPMGVRCLRGVVWVVLDALAPLHAAIVNDVG